MNTHLLSKKGKLGRRLAAHLLRRSTYHYSEEQITSFAKLTVSQAIERLFEDSDAVLNEPIDPKNGKQWINDNVPSTSKEGALRKYVVSWWVNEALNDVSIKHKLIFFLTSIFTVENRSVKSKDFFDYLKILDFYHKGSYKRLTFAITKSNAMLKYLDNNSNSKTNPNENYARELLELFTIGKGEQIGEGDYTNYTEEDIRVVARVLTGFKVRKQRDRVDPETQIPSGMNRFNRHDRNEKRFSNAFNNTVISGARNSADMDRELNAMLDMIFNQKATAQFLVRRLYRFFIRREITNDTEQKVINPLVDILIENDYNLEVIVKKLLQSNHFYDFDDQSRKDETVGAIIKSPLELTLQVLSYFKLDIPNPLTESKRHYNLFYSKTVLSVIFDLSGQPMFNPESVAGFSAYYQAPDYDFNWFNPSTIIARYKVPEIFVTGKKVLKPGKNGNVKVDMVKFIESHNRIDPFDANSIVKELSRDLFPIKPNKERFSFYKDDILNDGLADKNWFFEWKSYKETGDDSSVRIQLNRLFTALVASQEFQCN